MLRPLMLAMLSNCRRVLLRLSPIPALLRRLSSISSCRAPRQSRLVARQRLPPGSPASVANVGTANAIVLDFAIPEGDPGD